MARAFDRFLEDRPNLAPLVLREFLDRRGPGRRILVREIAPLLDVVERRVGSRALVMAVVSDLLLRSAAGPLACALWGSGPSAKLARLLYGGD